MNFYSLQNEILCIPAFLISIHVVLPHSLLQLVLGWFGYFFISQHFWFLPPSVLLGWVTPPYFLPNNLVPNVG